MARIPETQEVHPNEGCARLIEVNLPTSDFKEVHRYQILYVIRNDRVAKHITDLGPANRFFTPELVIPGHGDDHVIVETVGRLRDFAADIRARGVNDPTWQVMVPDLLKTYANQVLN